MEAIFLDGAPFLDGIPVRIIIQIKKQKRTSRNRLINFILYICYGNKY